MLTVMHGNSTAKSIGKNAQLQTPAEEEAHTFQWIVDKPATEDETGLKHEECTMCHYERNEDTPIDKLDHIHTGITHHAAVPSTCSVQVQWNIGLAPVKNARVSTMAMKIAK